MNYLQKNKKLSCALDHLKAHLFNAYLHAIQVFYIIYK